MAHSPYIPPYIPDVPPAAPPPVAAKGGLADDFWRDRLLLGAFLVSGLLIAYQVVVTLLQPAWISPATDWLRAALAWPQLLTVVWVSLRLTRQRRPGAESWWALSVALLSYALARTLWTVSNQLLFHHGVPFPAFPDLFFVLQYPFFFLAIILLLGGRPLALRLRVVLDDLLWIGTAAALSWYFILARIYLLSGESSLAKAISLSYPFGDLLIFAGLVVAFTRPSRHYADRLGLYILGVAFASLFTADTLVNSLLLVPPHVYRTGGAPDLFWITFYLLVPLAGLVQLRLFRYEPPPREAAPSERPRWRDVLASLRALAPFLVTLGASTLIMLHAAMMSSPERGLTLPLPPVEVGLALLFLATLRQMVVAIEHEQMRREREAARASELALRETNRRMEEFLSIASHELKTPLASLDGNIQLMERRLQRLQGAAGGAAGGVEDSARILSTVHTLVERSGHSVRRIGRLIDDLLDDSRIREGRLEFRLEPCDLSAIVREAVAEQRLLAPSHTIRLMEPDMSPISVVADASRVGQVVTNYLSNALKYSREEQPVEVQVRREGKVARVCVHDNGIGIPLAEQTQIWERFHRAAGVTVQSGSGLGLGIGLYISKTVIERHHGQVGVRSAPGQGSTFWFTLPLACSTP